MQNEYLSMFCTKFPGTHMVSVFSYDRLTYSLADGINTLKYQQHRNVSLAERRKVKEDITTI